MSLSYRFATSTDRDVIMKGILEILFLEENKTSFFQQRNTKNNTI